MERLNQTSGVSEFILLGLSSRPEDQKPLFTLFLIIYLVTITGNLLIILAIHSDPQLHTPMYFFLSFLSFIDICFTTTIVPRMLVNFLSHKTISYAGCLTQMYFIYALGNTDSWLLVVMAFDRYVAICKPLNYSSIMNHRLCVLLMAVAWTGGFIHSMIQILFTFQLPFCGPNVIDHFICDLYPLLELACTDTHIFGLLVVTNSGFICTLIFLLLVSYRIILLSLRTHNSEGQEKALSACRSHIAIVVLFFVPCIFVYARPSSAFSFDKMVAIFYTILTPLLNPLIYNKEEIRK